MKTILAFALLIATANALSLDALRQALREELAARDEQPHVKRSISLNDYLASLDEPHPLVRSARNSVLCDASVCGATPHLDVDATCDTEWKPNYEVKDPATGCECLTEYKCCTGRCQALNMDACPKGTEFETIITDCCDCEVVKCVDCPAPADEESTCPRGNGARPAQCYTYTKNNHYANDDKQCWEPGCVEKASDAPADLPCDPRCQNDVSNLSECQFPYNTCAGKTVKSDCARFAKQTSIDLLDPSPLVCYAAPTEVDDETGGHYFDAVANQCAKCQKWNYDKLSCAAANAAASSEDCHQFGENSLDKKCFAKQVKQDQCECDYAECVANSAESEDEFLAGEVCPAGHVKMSGVSICMHPRDLCKMCPLYIEMDASDCPMGKVEQSQDCNGCPISECVRAKVPSSECACGKYALDGEYNVLLCDC